MRGHTSSSVAPARERSFPSANARPSSLKHMHASIWTSVREPALACVYSRALARGPTRSVVCTRVSPPIRTLVPHVYLSELVLPGCPLLLVGFFPVPYLLTAALLFIQRACAHELTFAVARGHIFAVARFRAPVSRRACMVVRSIRARACVGGCPLVSAYARTRALKRGARREPLFPNAIARSSSQKRTRPSPYVGVRDRAHACVHTRSLARWPACTVACSRACVCGCTLPTPIRPCVPSPPSLPCASALPADLLSDRRIAECFLPLVVHLPSVQSAPVPLYRVIILTPALVWLSMCFRPV
eukprot:6188389-Pleurochrysis_carterae.AAC.3